jgi:hypothetical protein
MRRFRVSAALLLAVMLAATASAQSQWYALYDEAVKLVLAGEFQQAEAKLLQAKKEGPSPGRNVLRYGSLRAPFFPDYYLGLVYNGTQRPKEALEAFAAARASNIDARNNEFRLIGTQEAQARAALANVGSNPGSRGGPGPAVPTVDPKLEREKFVAQFEQLFASARTQLQQRSYEAAEGTATNARNLSIKQGLSAEQQRAENLLKEISGTRLAADVEDALNRKDPTAAQRALTVLSAAAPTFATDALKTRVDRLVRDSTPVVPIAPTNPGTNTAASIAQFENLFNSAKTQLSQRNYAAAEQAANTASRLAIKQGIGQQYEQRADGLLRDIDIGRRATRVEAAIKGRDVSAARKELSALAAVYPTFDARPLSSQVDRIDNEINAGALQRNAMRAFFNGSYQDSLTMVAQIERTGLLNARAQFYRACSLAALAATSNNPSQDRRLADAKKFYAEAAKSPDQFKEDLRYISPKVRQLLGI